MKSLYAPWRSEYAQSEERSNPHGSPENECVFCLHLQDTNDASNYIIRRFKHNAVMLNRYPYNAGHLLIIPYTHTESLSTMAPQARLECMELANACTTILQQVMNPHGFNLGLNLGKAAGAGMPSHIHWHVLPRWRGDTNFLATLAETKTISIDLNDLYVRLKPLFEQLQADF